MPRKQATTSSPPVYRNKPLQPHRTDSYQPNRKYAEPTACPDCGAVYHDGRWQWLPLPASPHRDRCPACLRIHDDMPAGYVHLEGEFVAGHLPELRSLILHVEQREKSAHPLNRIIALSEQEGRLLITTTDVHLARDIGVAVHNACQGTLKIQYGEDENLVRVSWRR